MFELVRLIHRRPEDAIVDAEGIVARVFAVAVLDDIAHTGNDILNKDVRAVVGDGVERQIVPVEVDWAVK